MPNMYNCLMTPEELLAKIDEVIAFCEANGVPATDYVVVDKIGISEDTLCRYRKYLDIVDDESASEKNEEVNAKKRELAGAIKKLDRYRNHFWQIKALSEPKTIGIANFALKQQSNGGWSDKEGRGNQAVEITVKMGGMDSSEAFG